jgi:hypothetical protein
MMWGGEGGGGCGVSANEYIIHVPMCVRGKQMSPGFPERKPDIRPINLPFRGLIGKAQSTV